jgi:DNA-binding protein HU-beta
MNKGDLRDAVADRMGETKVNASKAVDAVLDVIAEGIRTDGKVAIASFGTFQAKERAARRNVHPTTRKEILVGPSVTVTFNASPALKDSIELPPQGNPPTDHARGNGRMR